MGVSKIQADNFLVAHNFSLQISVVGNASPVEFGDGPVLLLDVQK